MRGVLEERGLDAEYVNYLEQTPTREELEHVMTLLGIDDPRGMMRIDEPEYRELGLESADRDELLDAMLAHPILIQRPIITATDGTTVVGRDADSLRAVIDAEQA